MNNILSRRMSRALAAVLLACGILAVAAMAQGLYAELTRRPSIPTTIALARLAEGDLVGRISVARVGLDTPVYEGIDEKTLAQGPGHVPNTPLPGRREESANSIIAISRGEEGSRVAGLKLGDAVEMKTPFGLRRYRVVERRLMDPQVIRWNRNDRPRVTLLTPYPPEELGPAPMRLALALEER